MLVSFAPGTREGLKAAVLAAAPEATAGDAGGFRVLDLDAVPGEPAAGPDALVFSSAPDERRLETLFARHQLFHLVLPETPAVELAAVLRRMAGAKARGCADVLGPTEQRHAWRIADSSGRATLLDGLRQRAGVAGVSRRGTERLVSIAEELITNALYNAPTDEQGRPLHAHKSRGERVVLDGDAPVEVEFAADEERVALVVRDGFGTLTAAATFDNLARCLRADHDQVDGKAGGAGLGLYTVLCAANHLLVTRGPGLTEVVAIVDKRAGRPTGRCFSWFEVRDEQ